MKCTAQFENFFAEIFTLWTICGQRMQQTKEYTGSSLGLATIIRPTVVAIGYTMQYFFFFLKLFHVCAVFPFSKKLKQPAYTTTDQQPPTPPTPNKLLLFPQYIPCCYFPGCDTFTRTFYVYVYPPKRTAVVKDINESYLLNGHRMLPSVPQTGSDFLS